MHGPTSPAMGSFTPQGASAQGIADEIEKLIRAGKLGLGERMRERALAFHFGVSRGPVREALKLLQSRGLVQIAPRRGAIVSPLAREEMAELLDIGAALIALALRRAATRRSNEEAVAIGAAAMSLRDAAEDLSAGEFTTRANAVLNNAVDAARSANLAHLSRDISCRGVPVAFAGRGYATKQRRAQAARNCLRLAEAIEARDAERAERIGRKLCQQNRHAAEETLEERPRRI